MARLRSDCQIKINEFDDMQNLQHNTVVCQNVQSFVRHREHLIRSPLYSTCKVLFLIEPKVKAGDLVSLPGFDCVYRLNTPMTRRKSYGFLVFAQPGITLKFKTLHTDAYKGAHASVAVLETPRLVFLLIYKSPKYPFHKFLPFLRHVVLLYFDCPILLIGDCNVRRYTPQGDAFMDFLISFGLGSCLKALYSTTQGTLIDYCCSNFKFVEADIQESTFSYHFPICIKLNIDYYLKAETQTKQSNPGQVTASQKTRDRFTRSCPTRPNDNIETPQSISREKTHLQLPEACSALQHPPQKRRRQITPSMVRKTYPPSASSGDSDANHLISEADEVLQHPSKLPNTELQSFPQQSVAPVLTENFIWIPWGDASNNNDNYQPFVNTCTIDNVLTIFSAAYGCYASIRNYVKQQQTQFPEFIANLLNVISLISRLQFNAAKSVWVEKIMAMDLTPGVELELFGEEDMNGFRQLEPILSAYVYEERCPTHSELPAVSATISLISMRINGSTADDVYKIITGRKSNGNKCKDFNYNGCNLPLSCTISLTGESPPLVILAPTYQKSLKSTPMVLELFGTFYKLFACSFYYRFHFLAAFHEHGKWYSYDGRANIGKIQQIELDSLKYEFVKSCWYVKV